jgi:hypothetical protein
MSGSQGRYRLVAALIWVALFLAPVGGARPAPPTPLRIEDALGTLSLAGRPPIDVSPDGRWVAYTLENPR